jgi:hypothetical protein
MIVSFHNSGLPQSSALSLEELRAVGGAAFTVAPVVKLVPVISKQAAIGRERVC